MTSKSLTARLDRLATALGWTTRHLVVVRADSGGPAIERTETDLTLLRVPATAAAQADPESALSPEQRAVIGEDDTVIIVKYVEKRIRTALDRDQAE